MSGNIYGEANINTVGFDALECVGEKKKQAETKFQNGRFVATTRRLHVS